LLFFKQIKTACQGGFAEREGNEPLISILFINYLNAAK